MPFSSAKSLGVLNAGNDALAKHPVRVIAQSWQRRGWQLGVAIALGMSGAIATGGARASAQLQPIPDTAPDRNLGTAVSPLTPRIDLITGGARPQNGPNLFHSFSQFNIDSRRGAYFDNPVGVTNILSRVTGNNPSTILGTLGVGRPGALGSANLFLINPNGIIFGQNARLNVGGSFVGTTANALQFPDGSIFSASAPNLTPPTLTINPSAFLFNQIANQPIGSIAVGKDAVLSVGSVRNPRSLLLVGGNVIVDGGTLQGRDGSQIQIAGFTGSGNVEFEPNNLGLELRPNGVTGANLLFTNEALVNVGSRTSNAGSIRVTGGTLALLGRTQLSTSTFGRGNAGNVILQAANNLRIDNSTIFSQAVAGSSGNAGNIVIDAGSLLLNASRLDTNNFGSGFAGNVIISGRDSVVIANSTLTSQSSNDKTSNFGLIGITATQGSVLLSNSMLSTTNSGSGYAGDISISARDQVSIENQSSIFSRGNSGRIFIGESKDYSSFSPRIITINNSTLNTSVGSGASSDAGGISLKAGSIFLSGSLLDSTNFGSGIAGNLIISASDQVSIINSKITSQSENDNTSDFSFIKLEAAAGSVFLNNSQLNTTNLGSGFAGDIIINARDQLSILNLSRLSSQGFFGRILIEATEGSFLLSQSTLSTTNFGSSFAGDISISAREQVSIENQSRIFSRGNLGLIFIGESSRYASFSPRIVTIDNATLNTDNSSYTGDKPINAGGISIRANDFVSLANGTEVSSSTYRLGEAGAVFVRTNGGFVSLDNSRIFTTVESGGIGDGGNIEIRTGLLSLYNGAQLQTLVRGISDTGEPPGQGNAGKVAINVSDTVTVSGANNEGFPSAIFSIIGSGAEGTGGDITITAKSLYLNNTGLVSVDNLGSGVAGDITLTVREDLFLQNRGKITATTRSGDGGNINLTVGDFLVLARNSQITTEAGTAQAGGNGGNIDFNIGNTKIRGIFAAPTNDNNVQANAYTGSGGRIRVNASRYYDIDKRPLDPSSNDINASSTYGRQGEVELNEVDVDPNLANPRLQSEPIDPSSLIAQNCPARGRDSAQEENKFIVTGPGGLRPNPNDTLQNESVVTNWVTLDSPLENRTGQTTSANPDGSAPATTSVSKSPTYVEAQGWVIGEKGEVILTAQAPTVTPHNPSLRSADVCNGS